MTPGTLLNIPDDALPTLAGRVEPVEVDRLQDEYFTLLSAWWKLDDDPESMSMDEARRLVDRLDELYQALHRQGGKVPVRLPLERRVA
jgi:hypothetical protein